MAFLVPKKGVIVRDPETYTPLPEEGAEKPLEGRAGTFWKRRIRCGDVTVLKKSKKKQMGGKSK